MKLYVCGAGTSFGGAGHPCGKAANALRTAGYSGFDVEKVRGFKNVPFSIRPGMRDHIVELTGSPHVPVLVLDDGTAISGSGNIVSWAAEHPAGG
ncbi:MAG: glutathione S-transferase domain-containing protein [Thermoleophilia bacterium]|nr:glutathione S-transferase domain-containing protein [Thermoleophilia bacterium]